MIVLADLPFDPNVIIVFAMVVFAGIKALLEKAQAKGEQTPLPDEEEEFESYEHYEAELERQRAELEIPPPLQERSPPPLPVEVAPKPKPVVIPATPVRPILTAEEKAALKNLQLSAPSRRSSHSATKARVKKHLSSPTAAREALLLAEILGPPKALKPE